MTKIRTNVQSLSGQRHMKKNNRVLESTAKSLSSGSRITSASDDIASWAQGDGLNAQLRSKAQASRNANDAVSIVQIASGALGELSQMIIRARELAVQSASDSNDVGERMRLDREVQQVLKEIDRIANNTEFNGNKLFLGEQKKFTIHVDANKDSKNKLEVDLSDLSQTITALGIGTVRVTNQREARAAIPRLDYALNAVTESDAKLGAMQKRFEAAVSKLSTENYTLSGAKSRISDADVAVQTSKNIKASILSKAQQLTMKYANFDQDAIMKLIERVD